MSIVQVAKKSVEERVLQWTGENREELLSFAGESITFGEAGTPIVTSMGEYGGLLPGMLLVMSAENLDIMTPDTFLEAYAVESIDGLQASLEKHWNKAEREAASPKDWAVPHKKKLRIDDAKHVRLAWDMVDRVKDLSDEERASARRRILAKAHKLGINTDTWTKKGISKEDIDAEIVLMDSADEGSEGQSAADNLAQVPPPVDVFTHLLTHVKEEASEFIWALSKVQRYGLENACPKTGETNRDKAQQELAELFACIKILNEELQSAGHAPIVADEGLVEAAVQSRLQTLQMEHELGRFYTGSEG